MIKFKLLIIIILINITIIYSQKNIKDTITIIGVGDIMLGTDYPDNLSLPPQKNCYPLLNNVKDILINADITFGNLEGTFAGSKGKAKLCRDTSNCYVFRMPEEFINCITDAGFDLLSVANNHSHDFGYEGKMNTIKVLNDANIGFAGYIEYPKFIMTKDSITYGFCAFAPNQGTCNLNNLTEAIKIVKELDENCDIVIVSMHGGAEGANYQHVTRKEEFFLEQSRGNVYEFAHKMIDAGADVVFGHGPHITRAIEVYKNKFIAYSLGNFCTYSKFNLKGPNGIAPIIKIFTDKNGNFYKGQIFSIIQKGEGGPVIDTTKAALKKIIDLTQTDFSENKILFDDNGNFFNIPKKD
jgi:poly-gamma-glutamate capsule biosynthesis protein CapA/YwtB (metallophosphatase superfamily)